MARHLAPGQRSELWLLDVATGEQTLRWSSSDLLIEAPNWTIDGWLVVNGDGRLFRLPDDVPSTDPHDLVPGDLQEVDLHGLPDVNNDHCLDPDGRHIFLSCEDGHIHRADLLGEEPPVRVTGADGGVIHFLHGISPDGRELAWTAARDTPQGRVRAICCSSTDLAGDAPGSLGDAPVSPGWRQLTPEHGQPNGSECSPDGRWIWINSEHASTTVGHAQLFRMPVDGGDAEQFTFDERVNWFPHLSPDGSRIVYLSYPPGTDGHPADLQVVLRELLAPDEYRDLVWLPGGQGTINVNSWSPDSRRIAYVSYPPDAVEPSSPH